jgi:hypothetical protein
MQNRVVGAAHCPMQRSVAEFVSDIYLVFLQLARAGSDSSARTKHRGANERSKQTTNDDKTTSTDRVPDDGGDDVVVADVDGERERRETVGVERRHVDHALLALLHHLLHLLVVAGGNGGEERLLHVLDRLLAEARKPEERVGLLRRRLRAVRHHVGRRTARRAKLIVLSTRARGEK